MVGKGTGRNCAIKGRVLRGKGGQTGNNRGGRKKEGRCPVHEGKSPGGQFG